jgi:hypothetical protein
MPGPSHSYWFNHTNCCVNISQPYTFTVRSFWQQDGGPHRVGGPQLLIQYIRSYPPCLLSTMVILITMIISAVCYGYTNASEVFRSVDTFRLFPSRYLCVAWPTVL